MAQSAEPSPRPPGRQQPRQVLLVEDNPGDAGFVTGLIASAPHPERFEVSVVGSADALRTLLADLPDVVLFDLPVPDAGSLDHLRRLHDAAPDMPLVVLPGSYSDELEHRLFALGARDVVPKTQLGMVAHAVSAMLGRTLQAAIELSQLDRDRRHQADPQGKPGEQRREDERRTKRYQDAGKQVGQLDHITLQNHLRRLSCCAAQATRALLARCPTPILPSQPPMFGATEAAAAWPQPGSASSPRNDLGRTLL